MAVDGNVTGAFLRLRDDLGRRGIRTFLVLEARFLPPVNSTDGILVARNGRGEAVVSDGELTIPDRNDSA